MIGSVINIEYSTITEPFKINSKNPLEINIYIYYTNKNNYVSPY